MSILEDEENNFDELRRCKVNYLQAQNSWMRQEYDFLCNLILNYKQIIELTQQQNDDSKIKLISQNINRSLQDKIMDYVKIKEQTKEVKEELSVEQFLPMINSFEDKISRLQQDIKNRQSQLQKVQQEKNKEKEGDRKSQLRYLNSFDVYGKMLEKVRKEVVQLKIKKRQLENQLISVKEGGQEQSTQYTASKSKSKQSQQSLPMEQTEMSAFQKVVILLKKKRYQNDNTEQKIKKLKMKISEKKIVNDKLKKQIQGMQWRCIQNLQYGSNGYVESNYDTDLSIAGKSMYHNASFSFDVSRFIKPRS